MTGPGIVGGLAWPSPDPVGPTCQPAGRGGTALTRWETAPTAMWVPPTTLGLTLPLCVCSPLTSQPRPPRALTLTSMRSSLPQAATSLTSYPLDDMWAQDGPHQAFCRMAALVRVRPKYATLLFYFIFSISLGLSRCLPARLRERERDKKKRKKKNWRGGEEKKEARWRE